MSVEEMDLYDLLRFYVKKWLTIAIFVMAAGIAGIVYTFYVQSPQYESKATLLLVGTNRTSANQDSVVLNNYVQLFTSRRVLEPVIADQDYDRDYEELAASVSAQNVKNTDVINVSIATPDADVSRRMLESTIESFRSQAKALYGNNNIKINVVDGASMSDAPSNVRPLIQVGLAMVAGFAVAVIGLFFVYDYQYSRRVKGVGVSTDAVPATVVATKARAPKTIKKPASKKVTTTKKASTRTKAKASTKK